MAEFQKGGSAYIAKLIEKAIEDGSRTATVTGNHEIETAVRIPSDFTLILDGCHLCMADGVFSNMFNNEHFDTALGRTVEGTDRNIAIIGKNHPVLDGGSYNGLSEKSQRKDGYPEIWHNNLILFTNVDGFEMRDFACHNQRWWALNFVFCRNGRIAGLDFKSVDLAVEEDGTLTHGLSRKGYAKALVKNSDGVDLRMGCHHIEISDITGFTEDDTVALTNLNGRLERAFSVAGLPQELCYVTIRNIKSASFCTNVRLLNQGGTVLHDILIDGVEDTSADSPHMDVGHYGVRVGDAKRLYGDRHSTKEETYNITIRNVRSRAEAAVSLAGAVENLVLENIEAFDGAERILDERI